MALSGSSSNGGSTTLLSRCSCGDVRIQVRLSNKNNDNNNNSRNDTTRNVCTPQTVDCHCRSCRNYHIAAFTSYLVVQEEDIEFVSNNKKNKTNTTTNISNNDNIQTYRDVCTEMGNVERIYCKRCYSKLLTRCLDSKQEQGQGQEEQLQQPKQEQQQQKTSKTSTILVNMGSLLDSKIPKAFNTEWKRHRDRWQYPSWKASWTNAIPAARDDTEFIPPKRITGGCSCGKCQYSFTYEFPLQLQHCYCKLCRTLSGGPFQTWVPVDNDDWKWTHDQSLALLDTTKHGKRHVCTSCGSVMTIVYKDDPHTTWPAAGGFHDDSLPKLTSDMNHHLDRVVHICCAWKQPWYQLPNDTMERLPYAS